MRATVLIIDDEVLLVKNLELLLGGQGYRVVGVHDGASARQAMSTVFPDVVLIDLKLPDTDGTELMAELLQNYPHPNYILMTAHGSIRVAVEAIRRGATNYLTKPFEADELLLVIESAIQGGLRDDELNLLRKSGLQSYTSGLSDPDRKGTGNEYPSAAMRACMAKAVTAAASDSIVLLLGESGSGKDYLARYIHDHSARSGEPFFTVNCAAVAPELAESELFGHEAGAFTGSTGRKRGLLELAQGGTLLLNEIGDLSLGLQAKLLTFLDTRSFTRVGGENEISVSARIIAATNKSLEKDVAEGRFRSDLYYRINVFAINVPPLRQRLDDLPILVQDILTGLAAEMVTRAVPRIDPAAMDMLRGYNWPGNIRELRNVLERSFILSGRSAIGVSALSLSEPAGEWSFTTDFPDGRSIHELAADLKRSLIKEALRRAGGNKQEAARLLGITRHALAHQTKFLEMSE